MAVKAAASDRPKGRGDHMTLELRNAVVASNYM